VTRKKVVNGVFVHFRRRFIHCICIGYYLSAAYMNWIDPEIANLQPFLTLTG
jgi:hypothetical protein